MTAFLADENFQGRIIKGARRAMPSIDIVRVQDTEISGDDDPTLLDFATRQGRVLLSNDAKTLIGFASDRIKAGQPTCAIIQVHRHAPIKQVITDIVLIARCLEPGEWDNLLKFIPL